MLPPLVEYAGERDVRLIVENCPMEGWHPDGYPGNLAYSPELWEWMFSLGFYLNYDPSHLTWLGIDPIAALAQLPRAHRARPGQGRRDRPERPQPGGRLRQGAAPQPTLGTTVGTATGSRALGMIDWSGIVDALYQVGFDGVLSVEHEDPVWSGDEGRVLGGLAISHDTLRPLIRRESEDSLPLVRRVAP